MESTAISRRAAIVAAADKMAKKQILIQCQSFWMDVSLFFCVTRYIWFARINVRGNVLIAPVRLMKSPRNGSTADTNVFIARYPPLTMIRNDKFLKARALPLIPCFVSKYSYIGLANIYQNHKRGYQASDTI